MVKLNCVSLLTLWQRAQAWALWIIKKEVCTQSTHAFVLCKSTHGKVDSVLETFDLYNGMYPSLSIGAQIGEYNNCSEFHCNTGHALLITVEKDPQTADHGEELILVAGYKHHQFEVLASHSSEAIPSLSGRLDSRREGFSLVLMDHDPGKYLTDLHSLETSGLLHALGCSIIFICRERGADRAIREFVQTRENRYCIKTETRCLIELCYQSTANAGHISSSPLVS
uniref:Uncharacterized protein n=1 Tax=Neogobius melanostomus TaxID=47308 RepID=A0A8C6SI54_9GOBI